VRAFASNEAGIVCPPDHAFAGRDSIRIAHCESELMVLPCAPLAIGEVTRALVNTAGVTLRASAESNDVRMVKSLVQERVGIGILTWLDVMTEVRRGELAFVPLADPILKPLTLALCVVPYRQLSAAASLVLNRMEASFSVFGRG
jgi:DNA-binding transcriptional LysR family regulator